MIEVPESFLERLDPIATRLLGPDDATGAALAREVAALSEVYTRQRDHIRQGGRRPAARLRFFLPRDLPKIGGPLAELASVGGLPPSRRWRVLDLGAGYGATSLGVSRFAAETGAADSVHVTAVDLDRMGLSALEALAAEGPRCGLVETAVETRVGDVMGAAIPTGPFDLVVLGFVLNELGEKAEEASLALLRKAASRLADGGSVVVLEPALRETSRRLHRVRDRLVESSAPPHVFAPCLRGGSCPMLEEPKAWCHEDIPSRLPEPLVDTARRAGLRFERLTFSYLTLRNDGLSLRALASGADGAPFRVVSQPMKSKGKLEIFGCGAPGRLRLMRLDRHQAPSNAALDDLGRGDLISVEAAPPSRNRLKIHQEDRIWRLGR